MKLIPDHPEEFETTCSCPDWANPCKHIAAVFYTITQAIDSDPFILFLLRGLIRKKFLKKLKLINPKEREKEVQSFTPEPKDIERFHDFRSDTNLPPIKLPEGAVELIFSLLTPEPVFYREADLRQKLRELYRAAQRLSFDEDVLKQNFRCDSDIYAIYLKSKGGLFVYSESEERLPWNDLSTESIWQKGSNGLRRKRVKGKLISPELALKTLLTVPLDAKLSPSMKTYVYMAHFAWELVNKGHFIPDIRPSGDSYQLNFRPYFAFAEVLEIKRKICQMVPLAAFLQGRKNHFLSPSEVLTDFLYKIVHSLVASLLPETDLPSCFQHPDITPKNPLERAFMDGLTSWLSPLVAPEKRNPGGLAFLIKQGRKYWYLSPLIEGTPLSSRFSKLDQEKKQEVLDTLGILIKTFPVLAGLEKKSGLSERVRLSSENLLEFLKSGRSLLKALQIPIAVSGNLKLIESLKIKALSRKNISHSHGLLGLDALLDFDLKVVMEDKELSFEELRSILQDDSPLLRLGNSTYLLAPEELTRLRKALEESPSIRGNQAVLAVLTGEIFLSGESFAFVPPKEVKDFFLHLREKAEELLPPPGIKAKLRPYQIRGFRWIVGTLMAGFGACLADDMGLGKTLQTICAITYLLLNQKIRKSLIVAPTTLLSNWQKEFQRFAPEILTCIYHGPERQIDDSPVIITSYGILRSDIDVLAQSNFDMVVIDEAQNIKNPETAQTKAVHTLAKAPYRLALSGTPVENSLVELWSIFSFLNPGLLGNRSWFMKVFARPIEFLGDERARERLKKAVSPFILRREKNDPAIVPELPAKIEKDEWCLLTSRQAGLYQQIVDESLRIISGSDGIKRRGLVLKLLILLKQICNHPALYFKQRYGHPEDSGKLIRLIELLDDIKMRREKVLVFSQFRSMGEILAHVIAKRFGETPLFLHGGVPRKKREEMVTQFENDENPFVFLISLKAGGTGLNLVAATRVIHYDLWWNPAVESQATDRAYRIGQNRNVMVHRLITRHTLEEKINNLLLRKKELANSIISQGERWITELPDDELKKLVSLGSA